MKVYEGERIVSESNFNLVCQAASELPMTQQQILAARLLITWTQFPDSLQAFLDYLPMDAAREIHHCIYDHWTGEINNDGH